MFSQFALHERLLKAVAELKFVEPTPVQAAAIPLALEGRDLRVTAQTGSGKTAAFVLPILNRLIGPAKVRVSIKTLILLPTRELAQQTLKEVERFSQFTFIKSGLITGGEDFKVQAAMLRKVPDILIGTPGRMIEQLNAGNLDLKEVEVLVLDEADRMLDMGFADDVQRLVSECVNRQQTMLFSATTGGSTLRDMVAKVLNNPEHLQVNNVSDLNATTRQQIVMADHNVHKEQILNWLLANETYQKAIVFTNTRAAADRIYGRLVAQEYKAFVLHGEKDQKDRKLAIDRLKAGGVKILVATDVAARGLDVDGLDMVINFDMPRSGDEYVHRIGRTGRAGNDGLAISLICHGDWNLMSSIERYLKQSFERRTIKEVKGTYSGPKKVKASGKAVGVKKKKTDAKGDKKKAGAKSPT
ncbi:DEAD/DEAH box helicase, partial [Pseudomonas poae]|uniref:DEAD/DEAH box helicase n=1 Tax=Pseudomonas poae TaxID=200451 RepID=UPI001F2D72DE